MKFLTRWVKKKEPKPVWPAGTVVRNNYNSWMVATVYKDVQVHDHYFIADIHGRGNVFRISDFHKVEVDNGMV